MSSADRPIKVIIDGGMKSEGVMMMLMMMMMVMMILMMTCVSVSDEVRGESSPK